MPVACSTVTDRGCPDRRRPRPAAQTGEVRKRGARPEADHEGNDCPENQGLAHPTAWREGSAKALHEMVSVLLVSVRVVRVAAVDVVDGVGARVGNRDAAGGRAAARKGRRGAIARGGARSARHLPDNRAGRGNAGARDRSGEGDRLSNRGRRWSW